MLIHQQYCLLNHLFFFPLNNQKEQMWAPTFTTEGKTEIVKQTAGHSRSVTF